MSPLVCFRYSARSNFIFRGASMSERYFIDAPPQESRATLHGDEARHLAKVMRAKPGDIVTLFDGDGSEYAARVATIGRDEVTLEVLSHERIDRESAVHLTLGVALPKGDRQKWLVEKCVELGVARLVPLSCQHGVALPGAGAISRLRRGVIEASKQCGRNVLMAIDEPQTFETFIGCFDDGCWRGLAHPGGRPLAESLAGADVNAPFVAAVGPEGGFSRDEIELGKEWRQVGLGKSILRVETAAIAIAASVSLLAAGGSR